MQAGGTDQASSRTIYGVYAARAEHATGAQLAQQIVAISENRETAKQLEAEYGAPDRGDGTGAGRRGCNLLRARSAS